MHFSFDNYDVDSIHVHSMCSIWLRLNNKEFFVDYTNLCTNCLNLKIIIQFEIENSLVSNCVFSLYPKPTQRGIFNCLGKQRPKSPKIK